jgi:hypothetical protein
METNHLEDLGISRRIILKCIFNKGVGSHGLDSSGSRQGQVSAVCECSNDIMGSLKIRCISRLDEDLLASQERHCSKELVHFFPRRNSP